MDVSSLYNEDYMAEPEVVERPTRLNRADI